MRAGGWFARSAIGSPFLPTAASSRLRVRSLLVNCCFARCASSDLPSREKAREKFLVAGAIRNPRLVSMGDKEVRFRYRDRKDHNRRRTMTLSGVEFLRRFLLHLLPRGREDSLLRFPHQPKPRHRGKASAGAHRGSPACADQCRTEGGVGADPVDLFSAIVPTVRSRPAPLGCRVGPGSFRSRPRPRRAASPRNLMTASVVTRLLPAFRVRAWRRESSAPTLRAIGIDTVRTLLRRSTNGLAPALQTPLASATRRPRPDGLPSRAIEIP